MRLQDVSTLPRPNCKDLTVLYYTANKINEFFAETVRGELLNVIGELPLISVSQKPLAFGTNICVGDIGASVFNLYKQVLIGARAANTPFIATCEDDAVYTPEHFTAFRPPSDVFAYNQNRWMVYSWHKHPVFCYKENRCTLSQGILPKEYLIEALEERFSKVEENEDTSRVFAEPGRYEKNLRVTIRNKVAFMTKRPNVVICHLTALDHLGRRKKLAATQAEWLRDWGSAGMFLHKYMGLEEWRRQSS